GIVPAIDNSCNLTGSTADNTTPAAPLPCALDDANIGSNNSTATNTDSYVTGTDPYFKLGDLVNSDSDDDAEYVVIDFNVVVDNNSINATSQNDNGETRDNRARGYINGSQSGSDSSAVQVKIVEPVVKITKTVDDLFPAPGQIVHFTLTLAHDMAVSKADAFDVSVSDVLPSDLDLDASSIVITPSVGASGVTNTSNDLTNTVSATIDTFPLGAGLTITFDATVVSAYGTTIDNTASITWTSLPGTDANERTGDGSGANDYADSSSVSLSETRNLAKNLIAKSLNNIGTSYVTIGEILTYQLILTIPANSTDTYIVTDTLDSGLAFLDCSDIVADADITSSVINFTAPGNCNHGTGPGSNPLIENSGGKVTFNFGTVTNANAGSAETITITYRVVVLDTTANQSGVALSNEATGTWSTSSTTKNAPAQSIIQPTLEIEKTVDKTVVQPGSTVTFTLHVHHAAGSETDAYDLVLTDTLDPELINPTNFTLVSGAPWTNLTIGPSDIIFQWDSLPLGAEAVVQFDATISFNPVQRQFHNNASLEWTSLPGDFSAPQSTYNDFSTERRYDPTRPADVYAANAQVLLTIPRQPRTGFAPNEITSIPPQPDDKTYQDLGDFWLEIPRLGVKIPIVGIPLSDDGEWDLTWLADQAGYLDGTAYPTHTGNSVITAHVYMPDGQPGPFVNLSTLQWGDQIIIHLGGQRYIYEVRSEKVISPENTSVFKHQDYPWLTLITCKDYDATTNTYTKRVAVQAVLVKVEP
ncbi:MAG: sortase, partial [Chloroflexi bacterium]|nr:sortase [Chloroflexota bacterium]